MYTVEAMSNLHFWLKIITMQLISYIYVFRMMSDYNVETINDGISEFNVEFHGPKESMFL